MREEIWSARCSQRTPILRHDLIERAAISEQKGGNRRRDPRFVCVEKTSASQGGQIGAEILGTSIGFSKSYASIIEVRGIAEGLQADQFARKYSRNTEGAVP